MTHNPSKKCNRMFYKILTNLCFTTSTRAMSCDPRLLHGATTRCHSFSMIFSAVGK